MTVLIEVGRDRRDVDVVRDGRDCGVGNNDGRWVQLRDRDDIITEPITYQYK